jgi:lysyl-tRNA synthetase class II
MANALCARVGIGLLCRMLKDTQHEPNFVIDMPSEPTTLPKNVPRDVELDFRFEIY